MLIMKCNQWKYGVAIALALGLQGCYMGFFEGTQGSGDAHNNQGARNQTANPQTGDNNTASAQPVQKTYATKEPTQKATPGPKQTAAPQLPVIQ